MKRTKEPPSAVSALRRWRDRQRHERIAQDQQRASDTRKSGLRRERAAERQAEQKAVAINEAASDLAREERYFSASKEAAESRRILGIASGSLMAFAVIGLIGASLTVYHLSHHPIPRDENALLVALTLLAAFVIALAALYGWFLFWCQPWLERKRDAAEAAKQLERIANKRQALENGAFTVAKSRRPFGGPYEVRFTDQKA